MRWLASRLTSSIDLIIYGEPITTAFVDSTVNEMVIKQQMQWSAQGAHDMIQMRTTVLNGELKEYMDRWYVPGQNESYDIPEEVDLPQAI